MGRVYFNPKTGEFWESSRLQRKPPKGFTRWISSIDRRYVRQYVCDCYFCPLCKEYHPIFILGVHEPPLYVRKKKEYGAKYGCVEAKKMVDTAIMLGGRKRHYKAVEKLRATNLLKKWGDKLLDLNKSMRNRILHLILTAREEEAELLLIAKGLQS